MLFSGQVVKDLKPLDVVVATSTVGGVDKNVLGRCLCTYRANGISLRPEKYRLKFVLPTLVRIIRLSAAVAEQLHFLRVCKVNLRFLFHRNDRHWRFA